jgi:hypothetical protein
VMLWILAGAIATWGAAADPLWEKSISFLPDYDIIQVGGVVVSSTTCLIHGLVLHSANSTQSMAFIKAFDMTTGALKWTHTLSLGLTSNQFQISKITNNIVYIKSYSGSWTGSLPNYIVTLNKTTVGAYEINTGNALWETTKDNFYGLDQFIPSVPQIDNKIILVGTEKIPGLGFSSSCVVSCYQTNGVTAPAVNSLLLEK